MIVNHMLHDSIMSSCSCHMLAITGLEVSCKLNQWLLLLHDANSNPFCISYENDSFIVVGLMFAHPFAYFLDDIQPVAFH